MPNNYWKPPSEPAPVKVTTHKTGVVDKATGKMGVIYNKKSKLPIVQTYTAEYVATRSQKQIRRKRMVDTFCYMAMLPDSKMTKKYAWIMREVAQNALFEFFPDCKEAVLLAETEMEFRKKRRIRKKIVGPKPDHRHNEPDKYTAPPKIGYSVGGVVIKTRAKKPAGRPIGSKNKPRPSTPPAETPPGPESSI